MKHARHRAERGIAAGAAPDPIEVAKELVCAVEKVNDHFVSGLGCLT
jgi:hypothetical protein